jgi:sulfhydrogenase subunit delta
MKKQSKPKVAFFDFTDCEGCQLQFANMGGTLLELMELVDIVRSCPKTARIMILLL